MTKRLRAGGAVCVGVSFALLVASAPATAAKKPITGKLSKPGYTVIALSASGKANSVRPKGRKFKLRPPAKRVTLHLRAKNGTYAGPIVVGKKKQGKRAILGVKAGAKLGKVKVKARKSYAKVKRKLAEKFVDAKRKARAKKGVPIGAGRFGFVRSKKTGGGAPGDLDLDGIADPLDIDDDGNLIIDSLDLSSAARASQADEANVGVMTGLQLPLEETANVSAFAAGGLTPQQVDQKIDTASQAFGQLGVQILSGASAELDCGGSNQTPPRPEGLVYCSTPGTGIHTASQQPFPGPRFGPFDDDGDGFGTLVPDPGGLPTPFMTLNHRATTHDIKAGDVLIECIPSCESGPKVAATIDYVFATVPALAAHSDTAGTCAQVSGTPGSCPTGFSYPVAPGGLGTVGNGFPVSAPAGQDVMLTLTFWRPQRRPIPGETCPPPDANPCLASDWIDTGGLTYQAIANPTVPGSFAAAPCPQSSYSSAELTPSPTNVGLRDPAGAHLNDPLDTVTYTLNVTGCLAALGAPSWDPGEEIVLQFSTLPTTLEIPAGASQSATFKRQP